MLEENHIQDKFLTALFANKTQIAIHLINGVKLQGTITGFDKFTIKLEPNCQLVLKHAIATVLPLAAIDWET